MIQQENMFNEDVLLQENDISLNVLSKWWLNPSANNACQIKKVRGTDWKKNKEALKPPASFLVGYCSNL